MFLLVNSNICQLIANLLVNSKQYQSIAILGFAILWYCNSRYRPFPQFQLIGVWVQLIPINCSQPLVVVIVRWLPTELTTEGLMLIVVFLNCPPSRVSDGVVVVWCRRLRSTSKDWTADNVQLTTNGLMLIVVFLYFPPSQISSLVVWCRRFRLTFVFVRHRCFRSTLSFAVTYADCCITSPPSLFVVNVFVVVVRCHCCLLLLLFVVVVVCYRHCSCSSSSFTISSADIRQRWQRLRKALTSRLYKTKRISPATAARTSWGEMGPQGASKSLSMETGGWRGYGVDE